MRDQNSNLQEVTREMITLVAKWFFVYGVAVAVISFLRG